MHVNSWMNVVFSLASVLGAGLIVVGGVVAVVALRNFASVVLLVGTILALLNSVGWVVFRFLPRNGSLNVESELLLGMRILGTISWLLTAVGVLLVAQAALGLRRRNQTLESIIAGNPADRVA